jgi:o-succinylbenzoate---CoA ligase
MIDWLFATAQVRPAAPALIYEEQVWTYTELDNRVAFVAAWLASLGIRGGEHLGVLMTNSPDYVCLIHAAARLGAVLIPLNARLTPAELQWQVEKVRLKLLIYAESTAEKAQTITSCKTVDIAQDKERYGSLTTGTRNIDLKAVQAIVFTSGTTGQPKGAKITFGNQFWSATASSWRLGVLPNDHWLLCLPLYHVGGMAIVLRCCLYGTTIILQNGFDLETMRAALEKHPVTLVSLVPTMLYRLMEADVTFPDSLRMVLLGGAAATPELVKKCIERNIPVATTYGLTEATSQVATLLPEDVPQKPGSVGKPLMFTSIRILDEHGSSPRPGKYGEIVVSGPTVMAGYFEHEDKKTLRDGELYTGDIGYLDKDGDLWIVQRRSDLIVSGGENVYPAEVETILRLHPAIEDACVVGTPSAEWGQQVTAAIVLKANTFATADDLIQFCRSKLAGYKCPRRVAFFDRLPQTASGKIHRQAVAERLAQQAEADPAPQPDNENTLKHQDTKNTEQ